MPDLSTGAVTLHFTDSEDSTALAQRASADPAASTAWAEGGRWNWPMMVRYALEEVRPA